MTTAPEITQPATKDLVRSVPFEILRDGDDPGDGLTFRGYAAVFNQPTEIRSQFEGNFVETIAPGAFRKTLREQTPVFQFDHGQHPMVGSIPLGAIRDAHEDDKGVFVEARLHDNWLTQPVRDGIDSGSIPGMSFRMEVLQDSWRDHLGNVLTDVGEIVKRLMDPHPDGLLQRSVRQVRSREMGPVVFPAYAGTSASVRSVTFDLDNIDDPEQRRVLAETVLFADLTRSTRELPPESPDDTAEAVVHDNTGDDDTPRSTETAAEHESEEPDGLRDAITRWRELHAPTIRHALEGAPRYE